MKRKDDLIHVRVKSGKYIQDHFENEGETLHWTGHTIYKAGEELSITQSVLDAHPGKFEIIASPEKAEA